MKKKAMAMLLAIALTFIQVAAVPVAAENLTMNGTQEQGTAWDDSTEEVLKEAAEDWIGEEEAEVIMPDDAEDTVASDQEQEIAWDNSAEDMMEESAEDLVVESVEEVSIPEDTAATLFSAGNSAVVQNQQYVFEWGYVDTIGNGSMLPNSQMTIATWLYDCTNNNRQMVTGYTLELLPIKEEYKGKVDIVAAGDEIKINSHSETGWFGFRVKVLLNGKEVLTKRIEFGITKYAILSQNITNPEIGQSVDIVNDLQPQLVCYRDGNGNPIPMTGDEYKIVIDSYTDANTGKTEYAYDKAGWNWIDVTGQELPILERIASDHSTFFTLTAMQRTKYGDWQPLAVRKYEYDLLPDNNDNSNGGGNSSGEENRSNYYLSLEYQNTAGDETMLPNSQMTISTCLYDYTNDADGKQVSGYTLNLLPLKTNDVGKFKVSLNGNDITIKSYDATGSFSVLAEVWLKGKRLFTESIEFDVNAYVILPERVTDTYGDIINPDVNAYLNLANDINPQLVLYKKGQEDPIPVTGDNYKIVINSWIDEDTGKTEYDYDKEGWKWIGSKKQELPTLKRISGCDTYVVLAAMEKDKDGNWNKIVTRRYNFAEKWHWISPEKFLDKTGAELNLRVGESINLADGRVGLVQYSSGIGIHPVGDPELKVIVHDYDKNGWTLQEVPESDLPIMTRTTKDPTWFRVEAVERQKNAETGKYEWCTTTERIYRFAAVTDETPHTYIWKKETVIKDATCTSTGIGINTCECGAEKLVTIPAKGHTSVEDAAVAATCTTTGKTTGSHCSVCGKVLAEQKATPVKNHTEVKDAAVEATVFAEGKTAGSHCSVCGTVLKKQDTVVKLAPTISLTAASLKMKTGQSTNEFKASGLAAGDYVTKVTADNTGIVKVQNVKKDGTFKLTAGKKAGTATVTVFLASGNHASFKVAVQKGAVKTAKITAAIKKLTITKGETYKSLADSITVAPITSKEKITYSSSNKKVATVSSKGVIKAQKAGTAKITVKSGSKKVVVTVKVIGVKTTKLSAVPEIKTIKKGKTFKIKAVAAPKNTDDKITYKSSNKKIATVTSKGVVKGLRKGTVTITVQSGSQKKSCKVTVR